MELTVKIKEKEKTYPIYIGSDIINRISESLTPRKILIISSPFIFTNYGEDLFEILKKKRFKTLKWLVPPGEKYKSWQEVEKIVSFLLENNFHRDDIILALGGGVIGDLAGFVAAIYQRGIPFIQVPTTLLAQVDSSVGGKVAVNHSLGKNMLGAFYQPQAVWIDLKTLLTLPPREWRAGLAEVIKYGVIKDEDFFAFLEQNTEGLTPNNEELLKQIVANSCQIKGTIVELDEQDQGVRNILNFGHTIGHALESVTDYTRFLHGEAVAIGMVAACQLAVELGIGEISLVERIKNLLLKVGLPVDIPQDIDVEKIINNLALDKKINSGKIRFVLPRRVGSVEFVDGVEKDIIYKILREGRK